MSELDYLNAMTDIIQNLDCELDEYPKAVISSIEHLLFAAKKDLIESSVNQNRVYLSRSLAALTAASIETLHEIIRE